MKTKFALCTMLVCIASAVAVGQQVSVNYNHSQSFAGYHTYAWQIDDPNKIANSILAQVAITDTDSALAGKGFSKVDISAKSRPDRNRERRLETGDLLQCLGHAGYRRRNGRHHSRTECRGNIGNQPL